MADVFKSKFVRALELTKMMTQVGFKELKSGSLQSRLEQAQIITESLSQLRGAAMKAGQILSLDLEDYFPPEAIKILSQLQSTTQDLPQIDVRKILKQNLSEEILNRVIQITTTPFAAASMGQVYKAQIRLTNGEKKSVVFKVLYPGLIESIDSDVSMLKKAVWAFCKMSGREMNIDPLFEEIQTTLKNEVNYKLEKQSHEKFHELFEKQTWSNFQIKTPQVYDEFCSSQFLCLSYEEGLTLRDWLDTNPSADKREQVALSLLDLYMTEFFVWGLVQTDPNPSNFIIQNSHIVALDFGATKPYDIEFRKKYIRLLKAIHSLNDKKIIEEAQKFGLLSPRESAETLRAFVELLKLGVQPFHQTDKFNFSDDSFLKENSRLSRELLKQLKYSPPPHQLIFLHRKLGGIYAILRKLKVEIDVNQFWKRIESQDANISD
jgi:aarF domain-containing kinase